VPGTVKIQQNALLDNSKYPALIAHSGTAGTSLTRRVTSQYTAGALDVHVAGGTITAGTITIGTSINTYGTSGSITDGSTGTIVDYVTPAGFELKGFVATGEGQGFYYLQIGAGTTKYSYRTSIADKNAQVVLPNPEVIAASTNLFLKIDNENGNTVNFEGAILGE
jgi:hypothetical protein